MYDLSVARKSERLCDPEVGQGKLILAPHLAFKATELDLSVPAVEISPNSQLPVACAKLAKEHGDSRLGNFLQLLLVEQ
jgi:hypothetical protein